MVCFVIAITLFITFVRSAIIPHHCRDYNPKAQYEESLEYLANRFPKSDNFLSRINESTWSDRAAMKNLWLKEHERQVLLHRFGRTGLVVVELYRLYQWLKEMAKFTKENPEQCALGSFYVSSNKACDPNSLTHECFDNLRQEAFSTIKRTGFFYSNKHRKIYKEIQCHFGNLVSLDMELSHGQACLVFGDKISHHFRRMFQPEPTL